MKDTVFQAITLESTRPLASQNGNAGSCFVSAFACWVPICKMRRLYWMFQRFATISMAVGTVQWGLGGEEKVSFSQEPGRRKRKPREENFGLESTSRKK